MSVALQTGCGRVWGRAGNCEVMCWFHTARHAA
jgi:hypothetical protein